MFENNTISAIWSLLFDDQPLITFCFDYSLIQIDWESITCFDPISTFLPTKQEQFVCLPTVLFGKFISLFFDRFLFGKLYVCELRGACMAWVQGRFSIFVTWKLPISFAISFALWRGFRWIRCIALSTIFFVVALFGWPLFGLSFTLPISSPVLWCGAQTIYWYWSVLAPKQPFFAKFSTQVKSIYSILLHFHDEQLLFCKTQTKMQTYTFVNNRSVITPIGITNQR